jgi:hypothetical protein
MVTTLAGSSGSALSFYEAVNVAIDNQGNLYVVDRHNHIIRKVTPDGTVKTVAGRTGVLGNSDGVGDEEVWSALEGDIKFLLGRDIRDFPVGTAYKVPPDGAMYQANMNFSDKKVKLFGFANMK